MSSVAEPKTPSNGITPKNTIFTTPKWPSSRRTHSLSSSPSLSSDSSSSFRSFSNDDSPSPSPPHRIPFSWESIPGIPKHQIIKRLNSSSSSSTKSTFLPLPPAATSVSATSSSTTTTFTKSNYKKQQHRIINREDPFYAALVECSKGDDNDNDNHDDDDDSNKAVFGNIWKNPAKSLSHGLGFVNLSCKNTCSVAESLVFLPREQPKRISYGLVKKHSG